MISDALLIFVCQFIAIAGRTFQTQNVVHRLYGRACLTSLCLGIAGLTIINGLIEVKVNGGSPLVAVSYLVAGCLGSMAGIWIHPKLRRG